MIMAAIRATTPDLFHAAAVAEARAAVAAAEEARATAERRYRYSPHGERTARGVILREKTVESLKAAAQLTALEKDVL